MTVATDGGDWHTCAACGADYRSRKAALRCCEDRLATDGNGCFWCDRQSGDYHPTCDHPSCENRTHGHGPEGQTVESYCPSCSGQVATDGGTYVCENCGPGTDCSPDEDGQRRCSVCGGSSFDVDGGRSP